MAGSSSRAGADESAREVSRQLRDEEARAQMARAIAVRLKRCRTHSEYIKEVERLLDSGAMPVAGLSTKLTALERHTASLERALTKARASETRERAANDRLLAETDAQLRARAEADALRTREMSAANGQLISQLRAQGTQGELRLRETAERQAEMAKLRTEAASLRAACAELEHTLGAARAREEDARAELGAARNEVARLQRTHASAIGERARADRVASLAASALDDLDLERERADAAVSELAGVAPSAVSSPGRRRASDLSTIPGMGELHSQYGGEASTRQSYADLAPPAHRAAQQQQQQQLPESARARSPGAASAPRFVSNPHNTNGRTPAYAWALAPGDNGHSDGSGGAGAAAAREELRAARQDARHVRDELDDAHRRVGALEAERARLASGVAEADKCLRSALRAAESAAAEADARAAAADARSLAADARAQDLIATQAAAAQKAHALDAELARASEASARARTEADTKRVALATAREAAEAAEQSRAALAARLATTDQALADSQERVSALTHALALEVAAKQRALSAAHARAADLSGLQHDAAAAGRALDSEAALRQRLEVEAARLQKALALADAAAAEAEARGRADAESARRGLDDARAELGAQACAHQGLSAEVERLGEALRQARQQASEATRELDVASTESREARAVAVEAARRLRTAHTNADHAFAAEEQRHAAAEQRWQSDTAKLERQLHDAREAQLAEKHARMAAEARAAYHAHVTPARAPTSPAARPRPQVAPPPPPPLQQPYRRLSGAPPSLVASY